MDDKDVVANFSDMAPSAAASRSFLVARFVSPVVSGTFWYFLGEWDELPMKCGPQSSKWVAATQGWNLFVVRGIVNQWPFKLANLT